MVELTHIGTRQGDPDDEDRILSDIDFARIDGQLVLFATSYTGMTLSTFTLTGGGISLRDETFLPPGSGLGSPATLHVGELNNADVVITTGPQYAGLVTHEVMGSTLGSRSVAGNTLPGAMTAITTFDLGPDQMILSAHRGQDNLATYRVQNDGSLANPILTTLPGNGLGDDITAIAALNGSSFTHVFALSSAANSLVSFRVNPNGTMNPRATIDSDNGLYVSSPTTMALVEVAGTDFAVVAGGNSSSLSVVELFDNGAMRVVDHVIDGRDTRFDNATALSVVQDGDRAFVVAAGADDGVSLFQILPDGYLLHLDSFADTTETALTNVTDLAATMVGGRIEIASVAEADAGITRLQADVGNRGITQVGSTSAQFMSGTNADDVLWAMGGDDTLSGGAGDDILMGGYGTDLLTGGGGADTFVFRADEARNDTITDFNINEDRIDLSGLGLVYTLDALEFTTTGSGAIIEFRGDRLVINTHNGSSLRVEDFATEDFFSLTHLTPMQFGSILTFEGTSQNDILEGTDLEDTISGLGGNDTLDGGAGADRLIGGDGIDRVTYQSAASAVVVDLANTAMNTGAADGDEFFFIEEIHGSALADTLYGDGGDNRLIGYVGNDMLQGRGGDDALIGRSGNDTMIGGAGADLLEGGVGIDEANYSFSANGLLADLGFAQFNTFEAAGDIYVSIENLRGSNFADNLRGNNVANVIWGGGGNDNIASRNGNDTIFGNGGNDILMGGADADRLDGGAGIDRVTYFASQTAVTVDLLFAAFNTGEAAGDTFVSIEEIQGSEFGDNLLGTNDDNTLFGNNGRDFLSGRGGDDVLRGMGGDDDLRGGTGADTLDGGNGVDQASYRNAAQAVVADLAFGVNNTGDAANDVFLSIENLAGSRFADGLRGNDSANVLFGDDGNDWLTGRLGHDTLQGGNGNDVLVGGVGRDMLDGGGGIDRIDYRESPFGLTVDLRNPANNTREATGDVFVSVENIYGSNANDILTGDANNNTLWGAGGNDRLISAAGNDRLLGMDGNDQLNGGFGNDVMTGGAGIDTFVFAQGVDQITDFTLGEDMLRIADTLWNGIDYSVEDVIALFASNDGSSTVFDFGDGNILFVQGITDPESLSDSLTII